MTSLSERTSSPEVPPHQSVDACFSILCQLDGIEERMENLRKQASALAEERENIMAQLHAVETLSETLPSGTLPKHTSSITVLKKFSFKFILPLSKNKYCTFTLQVVA